MEINKGRAKRRGRNALADPRTHCVSVRLNEEELALLNSKRGNMKQGEWLRCAALDKLPPVVPEPNVTKWVELGRAAGNLNQIAKKLNSSGDELEINQIRQTLTDFRAALLGVSSHEGNAED